MKSLSNIGDMDVGKEGRGTVVNRGSPEQPRIFIYLSAKVTDDSQFPFEVSEHVHVTIGDDCLIITHEKKEKHKEPS